MVDPKKNLRAYVLLIASVFFLNISISYGEQASGMRPHIVHASAVDILGAQRAQAYRKILDPEKKESWQFWVPSNLDQTRPVGLMVYISPQESGELPMEWRTTFSNNNMIWLGFDNAGNQRLSKERVLLAILARTLSMKHYNVDVNRIYVAGLSGGGRVASQVMSLVPEYFAGAIYMIGVDELQKTSSSVLDEMKQSRFVFITGSEDFNRKDIRKTHKKYLKKGILNSYLIDVEGAAHTLPSADSIEQALVYLDGKHKDAE